MATINQFYDEFGKAIGDRTAALFIGAGMSSSAGYKKWRELIEDLAQEVGLNADYEHDFVTLAQFFYNQDGRNRARLTQRLHDIYGVSKPFSENHKLIASLPIETVWTTNYDPLIEDAFHAAGKTLSVKRSIADLAKHDRGRDATLYKMHGDAILLQEAVLIKDDYETYHLGREQFITALRGDLVSKSFLFIGFSFTDPNITYILSRVRSAMGQHTQPHYCIMKWPDDDGSDQAKFEHDKRRQELLNQDLQHNNIRVIMIDDWPEITDILRALKRRVNSRNVFVSGSAKEYGSLGEERVLNIVRQIGERLIKEDYNLVSGFGVGIGEATLNSALKTYYLNPKMALADRVIMRPFPQYVANDPNRAAVYTKHRRDMLSSVGYAIFLCGNKEDEITHQLVAGTGVREEFEIAKELGILPIPIGATEYVARDIWNEVLSSAAQFYPGKDVSEPLKILGDAQSSDDEIVNAVFRMIAITMKK